MIKSVCITCKNQLKWQPYEMDGEGFILVNFTSKDYRSKMYYVFP